MHYHDHTNVVFFLAGGCIEKRKQITCERATADILLLHAGEMHQTILAQRPTRYLSLDLQPSLLKQYNINETSLLTSIKATPDAKFLMLKMYHELLQNDEFAPDTIHMLLLELTALTQLIHRQQVLPPWLKLIYELLQDQWNQPISLTELARIAGVNPITISKYFPLYFGSTLGVFRRKLKIERSLALIKQTDGSLTDVVYACQFADQSHFIRNFSQFTSFSPRQYRKL